MNDSPAEIRAELEAVKSEIPQDGDGPEYDDAPAAYLDAMNALEAGDDERHRRALEAFNKFRRVAALKDRLREATTEEPTEEPDQPATEEPTEADDTDTEDTAEDTENGGATA